jgi:hypothetical protein
MNLSFNARIVAFFLLFTTRENVHALTRFHKALSSLNGARTVHAALSETWRPNFQASKRQILRCPTVLTVRIAQHKGGFQNNSHFLPRNFICPSVLILGAHFLVKWPSMAENGP